MKHILSFILFFVSISAIAQQQVEIIQLDSCKQFNTQYPNAFDDMVVRVQQPAQWNNSKTSMNEFFDTFFKQYVQKRAGGRITLSLLINKDGRCCFYRAQPNSNVRPNFSELKRLLDQTTWKPAVQNGNNVKSAKVLFIDFDGKSIKVTELQ
jgi:hypothetical protein